MKYIISKEKIIECMKQDKISENEIQQHVDRWIDRIDGKEAKQVFTQDGEKVWACEEEHVMVLRSWLEMVGVA